MKKFFSIAMILLAVGSISAEAPSLDKITKAIKESHTARVTSAWSRIDRYTESSEEKRKILNELIDIATDVSDDKGEAPAVGGGKNYPKLIGGGLLFAAGIAGLVGFVYLQNTLHRRQDEYLHWGLFGVSVVVESGGTYLFKSGWKSAPSVAGKTEAQAIEAFLEDRLQDLDDDDDR